MQSCMILKPEQYLLKSNIEIGEKYSHIITSEDLYNNLSILASDDFEGSEEPEEDSSESENDSEETSENEESEDSESDESEETETEEEDTENEEEEYGHPGRIRVRVAEPGGLPARDGDGARWGAGSERRAPEAIPGYVKKREVI